MDAPLPDSLADVTVTGSLCGTASLPALRPAYSHGRQQLRGLPDGNPGGKPLVVTWETHVSSISLCRRRTLGSCTSVLSVSAGKGLSECCHWEQAGRTRPPPPHPPPPLTGTASPRPSGASKPTALSGCISGPQRAAQTPGHSERFCNSPPASRCAGSDLILHISFSFFQTAVARASFVQFAKAPSPTSPSTEGGLYFNEMSQGIVSEPVMLV